MASYKKLPTGWQFRISYKDDSGEYRTKNGNGFRTKKDAETAALYLEILLKKGLRFEAGKVPFHQYFKAWFELYKKDSISKKTASHYQQSIDHIKAYFCEIPIGEITEDSYQGFLNSFGATHAKETASKLNIHCRSCFKRALKAGAVPHDPTDGAVVTGSIQPKNEKAKYLNEKDLEKVLASLLTDMKQTDVSRYFIIFSLASGVRFSEAQGLTWDCVNFESNQVRINKTWDMTKDDFAPTKNAASNRLITIDQNTIDLLKQLKKIQECRDWHKKNLVFLTYLSDVPTNNAVNKSLKRAIIRAGVSPIITHHGLRHTHVSLLLHKKVNIKYISRRLGHATVSTTYDTYAHIIDEMEQVESQQTSEIISIVFNNAKTMQNNSQPAK